MQFLVYFIQYENLANIMILESCTHAHCHVSLVVKNQHNHITIVIEPFFWYESSYRERFSRNQSSLKVKLISNSRNVADVRAQIRQWVSYRFLKFISFINLGQDVYKFWKVKCKWNRKSFLLFYLRLRLWLKILNCANKQLNR